MQFPYIKGKETDGKEGELPKVTQKKLRNFQMMKLLAKVCVLKYLIKLISFSLVLAFLLETHSITGCQVCRNDRA